MERFLRLSPAFHLAFGLLLAMAFVYVAAGSVFNSNLAEAELLLHIAFIFYWIWYPYAICSALIFRIEPKIELSYNWFLFNWVVTFLGLMLLAIASYVYQQDEFRLHGLPALCCFYFFYSLTFTFLFTARVLKVVEKGVNVSYGESVGACIALERLSQSISC
jgi:hypothetical protein